MLSICLLITIVSAFPERLWDDVSIAGDGSIANAGNKETADGSMAGLPLSPIAILCPSKKGINNAAPASLYGLKQGSSRPNDEDDKHVVKKSVQTARVLWNIEESIPTAIASAVQFLQPFCHFESDGTEAAVSGNAMVGNTRQYLFFPDDTFNDVFHIPAAVNAKIKDVRVDDLVLENIYFLDPAAHDNVDIQVTRTEHDELDGLTIRVQNLSIDISAIAGGSFSLIPNTSAESWIKKSNLAMKATLVLDAFEFGFKINTQLRESSMDMKLPRSIILEHCPVTPRVDFGSSDVWVEAALKGLKDEPAIRNFVEEKWQLFVCSPIRDALELLSIKMLRGLADGVRSIYAESKKPPGFPLSMDGSRPYDALSVDGLLTKDIEVRPNWWLSKGSRLLSPHVGELPSCIVDTNCTVSWNRPLSNLRSNQVFNFAQESLVDDVHYLDTALTMKQSPLYLPKLLEKDGVVSAELRKLLGNISIPLGDGGILGSMSISPLEIYASKVEGLKELRLFSPHSEVEGRTHVEIKHLRIEVRAAINVQTKIGIPLLSLGAESHVLSFDIRNFVLDLHTVVLARKTMMEAAMGENGHFDFQCIAQAIGSVFFTGRMDEGIAAAQISYFNLTITHFEVSINAPTISGTSAFGARTAVEVIMDKVGHVMSSYLGVSIPDFLSIVASVKGKERMNAWINEGIRTLKKGDGSCNTNDTMHTSGDEELPLKDDFAPLHGLRVLEAKSNDWLQAWLTHIRLNLVPIMCPPGAQIPISEGCWEDSMYVPHRQMKEMSKYATRVITKMGLHMVRYASIHNLFVYNATFLEFPNGGKEKWLSVTSRIPESGIHEIQISVKNILVAIDVDLDVATEALIKLHNMNITTTAYLKELIFTLQVTDEDIKHAEVPKFPTKLAFLEDRCWADTRINLNLTDAGAISFLHNSKHIKPAMERLLEYEVKEAICYHAGNAINNLKTFDGAVAEIKRMLAVVDTPDKGTGFATELTPDDMKGVTIVVREGNDQYSEMTQDLQIREGAWLLKGSRLLSPTIDLLKRYSTGTVKKNITFSRPVVDLETTQMVDITKTSLAQVTNYVDELLHNEESPFFFPQLFADGKISIHAKDLIGKEPCIDTPFLNIGSYSLCFKELSVGGLDTIRNSMMRFERMVEGHSTLEMGRFEFNTTIGVKLKVKPGQEILRAPDIPIRHYTISLASNDILFNARAFLMANEKKMTVASQNLDAPCVAQALGQVFPTTGTKPNDVAAKVSFFNFSLANFTLAIHPLTSRVRPGELMMETDTVDDQLDDMFDDMLQSFLSTAQESMPYVLSLLFRVKAREWMNNALTKNFLDAKKQSVEGCPHQGPPKPIERPQPPPSLNTTGALKWDDPNVMREFVKPVLSNMLNIQDINRMIKVLSPSGSVDFLFLLPSLKGVKRLGQWTLEVLDLKLTHIDEFSNLTVPILSEYAVGARVESKRVGVTASMKAQKEEWDSPPIPVKLALEVDSVELAADVFVWLDREKVLQLTTDDLLSFSSWGCLIQRIACAQKDAKRHTFSIPQLVALLSVQRFELSVNASSLVRSFASFDRISTNLFRMFVARLTSGSITRFLQTQMSSEVEALWSCPVGGARGEKSSSSNRGFPASRRNPASRRTHIGNRFRSVVDTIKIVPELYIDLTHLQSLRFLEKLVHTFLSPHVLNFQFSHFEDMSRAWNVQALTQPYVDKVGSFINQHMGQHGDHVSLFLDGLEVQNAVHSNPFTEATSLFKVADDGSHLKLFIETKKVKVEERPITFVVKAHSINSQSGNRRDIEFAIALSNWVVDFELEVMIPKGYWPDIKEYQGASFLAHQCIGRYIQVTKFITHFDIEQLSMTYKSSMYQNGWTHAVNPDRMSQKFVTSLLGTSTQVTLRHMINHMIKKPELDQRCDPREMPPKIVSPLEWAPHNLRFGKLGPMQWMHTMATQVMGAGNTTVPFSLNYFLHFPYRHHRIITPVTSSLSIPLGHFGGTKNSHNNNDDDDDDEYKLRVEIPPLALYSWNTSGEYTIGGYHIVSLPTPPDRLGVRKIALGIDRTNNWRMRHDVDMYGLKRGDTLLQFHKAHADRHTAWITPGDYESTAGAEDLEEFLLACHPCNLTFATPLGAFARFERIRRRRVYVSDDDDENDAHSRRSVLSPPPDPHSPREPEEEILWNYQVDEMKIAGLHDAIQSIEAPLTSMDEDLVVMPPSCHETSCTSFAFLHTFSEEVRMLKVKHPIVVDERLRIRDLRTALIISGCRFPDANGIYTRCGDDSILFSNGPWSLSQDWGSHQWVVLLLGQYGEDGDQKEEYEVRSDTYEGVKSANQVAWPDGMVVQSVAPSSEPRSFFLDLGGGVKIDYNKTDPGEHGSVITITENYSTIVRRQLRGDYAGFELLLEWAPAPDPEPARPTVSSTATSTPFEGTFNPGHSVSVTVSTLDQDGILVEVDVLRFGPTSAGASPSTPRISIRSHLTGIEIESMHANVEWDTISSSDTTLGLYVALKEAVQFSIHGGIQDRSNWVMDNNNGAGSAPKRKTGTPMIAPMRAIDLSLSMSDLSFAVAAIAEVDSGVLNLCERQVKDLSCVMSYVGPQTRLKSMDVGYLLEHITVRLNGTEEAHFPFFQKHEIGRIRSVDYLGLDWKPEVKAFSPCFGQYVVLKKMNHSAPRESTTMWAQVRGMCTLALSPRSQLLTNGQNKTVRLESIDARVSDHSVAQEFERYMIQAATFFGLYYQLIPGVNEKIGSMVNNNTSSSSEGRKNGNTTCPPPVFVAMWPSFSDTLYFSCCALLIVGAALALLGLAPRPSQCSRSIKYNESSLGGHPNVPTMVGLGVPLLVCGTLCLFLSSNSSIGATVRIGLTAGDKTVGMMPTTTMIHGVFDFTLFGTVMDMWNAGVYPLAILVGLFSGIVPYIKLLVMLYAWFSPPRVLSKLHRGRMLKALDVAGKWALVDTFVLVIFMASFRMKLHIPQKDSLMTSSDKVGIVDIVIDPKYGFYSFLVATVLSLILGHLVIAYHHESERADLKRKQRNTIRDEDDFLATTTMVHLGREQEEAACGPCTTPNAAANRRPSIAMSVLSIMGPECQVEAFSLKQYNNMRTRAHSDLLDHADGDNEDMLLGDVEVMDVDDFGSIRADYNHRSHKSELFCWDVENEQGYQCKTGTYVTAAMEVSL